MWQARHPQGNASLTQPFQRLLPKCQSGRQLPCSSGTIHGVQVLSE